MDSLHSNGNDNDETFADWLASVADKICDGGLIDLDAELTQHPLWEERLRGLLPTMKWFAGEGSRQNFKGQRAGRASHDPAPDAGSLGDFRKVRELGRGGMGVVYEAIQLSLDRRVALKVLPSVHADDPVRLRRFHVEAQAAACLTHPHIVPVYLVGSESEVPYFVMQLIEGRTVAQIIAESGESPTSPRTIAELGRQAALALQYAHEEGVIHRDIKPSNLLIDRSGWLWVADFGLALRRGSNTATGTGILLGTLRYLSPEQALGERNVIDHRVDLYSLGATLYEWLSGRPAFDGDDRIDLLRRIVQDEPVRLRMVNPAIPKDLETIVLKAMAKDPGERYATAATLAADLSRFLEDRPVLARPPSLVRRAAAWSRRHKAVVAAAVLIALAMIVGLGSALVWRNGVLRQHNRELARALARVEQQQQLTRRYWYGSQIRLAQQAFSAGQVEYSQEILEGLRPTDGEVDLRGFEWSYLRRALHRDASVLAHHDYPLSCLAVSSDGRTLATADHSGALVLWDLAEDREVVRRRVHTPHVGGLVFSPNNRVLASWSGLELNQDQCDVALWNPATGDEIARTAPFTGVVDDAVFAPDGCELALVVTGHARSSSKMMYWDLKRLPADSELRRSRDDDCAVAYTLDGRCLATAGLSGRISLIDRLSGRVVWSVSGAPRAHGVLAFSQDGRSLAAGQDGRIAIFDVESARIVNRLPIASPTRLVFSPDGLRLAGHASGNGDVFVFEELRRDPRAVFTDLYPGAALRSVMSGDGRFFAACAPTMAPTVWDATTGRKLAQFPGKTIRVERLAFSTDGRSVFLACDDGRVRSWHFAPPAQPRAQVPGHDAEVWALAYTQDGATLISAGDDHLIKLWDPDDGHLVRELRGHAALVASVALRPDGRLLASAGFDKTVRLWDLPGGEPRAVLRGHDGPVRAVAFAPDGQTLASGGSDNTIRLWNMANGSPKGIIRAHTNLVRAVVFDPRGRFLASASTDRTVRVIDASTGDVRRVLSCPKDSASIAFSTDGSLLVAGDDLGSISVWDVGPWTKRTFVKVSDAPVWGVAFSPDGRTLATACGDAKVRLWDPITGQVLLVLDGHAVRVNAVVFSPDGNTLASASHDGSVRLWRAEP
jgi:WD40 repeat protein